MEGTLRTLIKEVVARGTETKFARLALREDPFYRRVPPEMEDEAIDVALRAGKATADRISIEHGHDPRALAAALGVTVTETDEGGRAKRTVFFSEYAERPPSVTLYLRSIREVNQLIREQKLEDVLELTDVGPVHLAHELYHHLEAKKLAEGTQHFRVSTHRIGPVRLTTGLPSLSEIAADRFASAFLEMAVPPRALRFIPIFANDPAYAWSLLEELKQVRG